MTLSPTKRQSASASVNSLISNEDVQLRRLIEQLQSSVCISLLSAHCQGRGESGRIRSSFFQNWKQHGSPGPKGQDCSSSLRQFPENGGLCQAAQPLLLHRHCFKPVQHCIGCRSMCGILGCVSEVGLCPGFEVEMGSTCDKGTYKECVFSSFFSGF